MVAKRRMRLDVWLYGHRVAQLSEPATYRYRLDFTEEALDTYGDGSRVLSLSLPFSDKPATDATDSTRRTVSAFLDGLLPEGNIRRQIATAAGVPAIDKMALLERVGAECAGAVQIVPEGKPPDQGRVRKLSQSEVDRLVADLPTYHLPHGATIQASLAGIQDKVLLTALPEGAWGWPENGAVSSHIVKPEPVGESALPHLIEAEHWAMRVAREAHLPAAETRLDSFEGRAALIVTRYDRTPAGRRLHQEDSCQALGLDPQSKYESTTEFEQSGSRLSRLTKRAADRAIDPERFRTDLLSAVTFNVIIGNGDAHSKNYSLLIGPRGQISLAPAYDVVPARYLEPRFKSTGHVINGKTSIDSVTVSDLVSEARSWGLSQRKANATVRSVIARVRHAVDQTPLPDGTEHVIDRLDALWQRQGWAVP
jgi:serine/threonine-protein kinase HipA